jgi:hypothetical protein
VRDREHDADEVPLEDASCEDLLPIRVTAHFFEDGKNIDRDQEMESGDCQAAGMTYRQGTRRAKLTCAVRISR